jgi:hypothetical protein
MPMVEPYSRVTRTAIFYAVEDDCHATGLGKFFDIFPGSASRPRLANKHRTSTTAVHLTESRFKFMAGMTSGRNLR